VRSSFNWSYCFIWRFWSYSRLRRLYWSSYEIYVCKRCVFDALEAGQELAKDLKDELVGAAYFSSASNVVLNTNSDEAFQKIKF
jgi:hypothetical protein